MTKLPLLALALVIPRSSEACDRARMPSSVIVAAADLVMLGEVLQISGPREILVKPLRVLKGEAKGPVTIGGVYAGPKELRICPEIVVEKGGRYVFAASSTGKAFRIVDPDDGVSAASAVERAENDVKLKGAHASVKELGSTGLTYTLVAPRMHYGANDDIDLFIMLDNTGKKPVQMTSRTWPPKEHTFCSLQFTPTVAAVPVPIAKQDIADYFAKHGPRYDLAIEPNTRWRLTLQRVNTATPGWGYKEELGFMYYPLKPGEYRVRATCRGYFTIAPIETNEIALVISP